MKIDPIKCDVESRETELEGKLCERGWFAKVTVRSSIMLGTIVQVRCETWQLVWYLGTQTGFANHHIKPVAEHALASLLDKLV